MSAPVEGDVAVTEAAIAWCIERAISDGLIIVYDAKVVPETGAPRGVCAMGAYERLGQSAPALALPSAGEALSMAYDAIETGFDGHGGMTGASAWTALGQRLRARFNPIPASALMSAIETERSAVGVIRFT